jgi:hypothetical protein
VAQARNDAEDRNDFVEKLRVDAAADLPAPFGRPTIAP